MPRVFLLGPLVLMPTLAVGSLPSTQTPPALEHNQSAPQAPQSSIAEDGEKALVILKERRLEQLPELFERLLKAGEDLQFRAVHNHWGGFCSGTLTLTSGQVTYTPAQGDHGFQVERESVAALATTEGQIPTIELRVKDATTKPRSYTFFVPLYLQYQRASGANRNVSRSFVGGPSDYSDTARFNNVLVGLLAPTPVTSMSQGTADAVGTAVVRTNWKKELEQRLESQWPRAKLNLTRDNIRQPGAPLLLMQGGVLADSDGYPTNDIVNGFLQPQGASNKLGAFLNEASNRDSVRNRLTLPQYQPVFISDARVSDDSVILEIVTRTQFISERVDRAAIARFVDATSVKGDTLTKVDVSIRKAALVFRMGQDLPRRTPDDVIAVIQQMILRPEHPDAPQFGTVAIGMSREQVIRNMGKPQNVAKLDGDREILVYESLKVTLRGGKVIDVQ